MIFRIFIGCLLLVSAYVALETAYMAWRKGGLLSAEDAYVLESEAADLTFVAFLDYNCSHCKDAHPLIQQALEDDGRIRFVPRPIDLLEGSEYKLSRFPYAAARQGEEYFAAMHDALLNEQRPVDDQVLQDITLVLGIDMQQLLQDYNSEAVIAEAAENMQMFERLRLRGIPSYAVGPDILFTTYARSPGLEDFASIFAEARGQ